MSIVIIVSLHRKLEHKKKKKKEKKETKTEHPCLVIWMSHLIVSICMDASTNGVCWGSSQSAGNTPSVVHVLTWFKTC